jgi:hypothetical protein
MSEESLTNGIAAQPLDVAQSTAKPEKSYRFRPKTSGRKKGTPNKPGGVLINQDSKLANAMPKMTPTQILDAKVEILRLMADGLAKNVTEACKKLNLQPARVHGWAKTDKDFKEMLDAVYEVIADEIETGFLTGKNDIPKMMMLKGIRPQYRDNYKVDLSTEKVEQMLADLKKLGQGEITTKEKGEQVEGYGWTDISAPPGESTNIIRSIND